MGSANEIGSTDLEITFEQFPYQLTQQGFPNYSEPMDSELNSLEEKINQFVRLCQQLRTENIQLRQQLARAASENKHLAEKISAAAGRLDALLMQLPENEE
jgi:cell division protein ZapB